MRAPQLQQAIDVALATASELTLDADEAIIVYNSDRIAVRLLPCDVLVRVGLMPYRRDFELEVDVARQLTAVGSPVGELDPRVSPHVDVREGYVLSFWSYYEPLVDPVMPPSEYAEGLVQMHAGLRKIVVDAPRFTDQVGSRQRLLADRTLTPELEDIDRRLLTHTLDHLSESIIVDATDEQLLHGEPHPGNVLHTASGPRFIDLATCCRGPIEYDLAFTPDTVDTHYPGADLNLVLQCRALMWAMFATQRWSDADQMPDRHHWRTEGLRLVRMALERAGMERA